MKNYKELLKKISGWMKHDSLLFIHHFCHKTFAYHFEVCPFGPCSFIDIVIFIEIYQIILDFLTFCLFLGHKWRRLDHKVLLYRWHNAFCKSATLFPGHLCIHLSQIYRIFLRFIICVPLHMKWLQHLVMIVSNIPIIILAQDNVSVVNHWLVNGKHYAQTR